MNISDINFSLSVQLDRIDLSWKRYSDIATYVLVKKRISSPIGRYDGNQIYVGRNLEYSDFDVVNGEIYYYRLFVLPDPNDEWLNLSDGKCCLRAIALNEKTMVNYGRYLYERTPKDVRYRDATLKGQNYPLRRFMDLFSYPFNEIGTFADTILSQTDIESCDEKFLPYHASWASLFYDERLGSDTNRLLIKTMQEAEPYIGTETGLKYILQRVFKAEVEFESNILNGCFTNRDDSLTSYNLMTNGCTSTITLKLYFDDNNSWLSNMQTTDTIMKILIEYCPARTRFDMIVNLVSNEEYDRVRMDDDYLHDFIMELIVDNLKTKKTDELFDNANLNELIYENYKGLRNISQYPNNDDAKFGVTLGKSLTNVDLVTNAMKHSADGVAQTMTDVVCQTNTNTLKTNARYSDNSVISYLDTIVEVLSPEQYDETIIDGYMDKVIDVFISEYLQTLGMLGPDSGDNLLSNSLMTNSMRIMDRLVDIGYDVGSVLYEQYKLKNISTYNGSDSPDFGQTGGSSTTNVTLVTNATNHESKADISNVKTDNIGGSNSTTNTLMTNARYSKFDGSVAHHDTLKETVLDDKHIPDKAEDVSNDTLSEHIPDDEFTKEIVDVMSADIYMSDDAENYKLNNISSYPNSGSKDFSTTTNSLISGDLVTNAVRFEANGVSEEKESITNGNQTLGVLLTNGVYFDNSRVSYKDSLVENINIVYTRLTLLDAEYIDSMTDDEIAFVNAYADELVEVDIDVTNEVLMLVRDGRTNDAYSLLNSTFLTNVKGRRTELERTYVGMEAKTNVSVLNAMLTNSLFQTFDTKDVVDDVQSMDAYGGVKSEFEQTREISGTDESVGSYSDDVLVAFYVTRPHSITCSECVLANSFYTTDIKY